MIIRGTLKEVQETTEYLAYIELELDKIEAIKEFDEYMEGVKR